MQVNQKMMVDSVKTAFPCPLTHSLKMFQWELHTEANMACKCVGRRWMIGADMKFYKFLSKTASHWKGFFYMKHNVFLN